MAIGLQTILCFLLCSISITTSYSEESDGQPIQLKQQTTITENPENPVLENTPTVIVTEIVVGKSTPQDKVVEEQSGAKPEDNLEGNNSWDRYINASIHRIRTMCMHP